MPLTVNAERRDLTLGDPQCLSALRRTWGKSEHLTSDEETLASCRASKSGGETPLHPVWAGEALALIHDVPSALDIVRDLVRGAEDVLRSLVPAT